jgi:hypothetical protein
MAGKKPIESVEPPLYSERLRFKQLLFSKAAGAPKGNTTYEEIACVGFQPELDRLEAVVHVKQPVGYGGDVCSPGTPEYVRFFLSYDGGATWQDQGYAGFMAHDIPEAAKRPIEYAVTVTIRPRRRVCWVQNLVLARAILSWQVIPQAGNPDFKPHWGNRHDTTIQIGPATRPPLKEFLELSKAQLPAEAEQVLDLDQEVATLEPKALTLAQLKELYRDKKVEPHRFGFSAVLKLLDNPQALAAAAANQPVVAEDLGFDLAGVLQKLSAPKGDTFYEELDCIGLDPAGSELVATFRVKQSYGYSGGPCTPGSLEYVTFWADFDGNGTFEHCLGTVAVRVHDFERVPKGGLEYAASLPVHLAPYARPCKAGPKLVRIRAMLSWATPHSCLRPDKPPVWGNAKDTVIQIPPGPPPEPNVYKGYLYTVCAVNICDIAPDTGLTSADQPFGATLNVTGEIPAAPAVTVADRFKYKVWVRSLDPVPGPWQSLSNDFWIWVTEGSGLGIPSTHTLLQQVDPAGWYTYREYGTPVSGNWRRVTGPNRLLGQWATISSQTGRWEIGLEFLDTSTSVVSWAEWQTCPTFPFLRRNAIVRLDQVKPAASLSPLLEVSSDGGATWTPAQKCDTFVVGVLIRGTYSVSDEHFRVLNLYVQPADAAHGTPVTPSTRIYPVVPTTGETGTWTLDTTNMDPCGYVVRLDVWDRTIVSCDDDGWSNWASLGFCLKAKS